MRPFQVLRILRARSYTSFGMDLASLISVADDASGGTDYIVRGDDDDDDFLATTGTAP